MPCMNWMSAGNGARGATQAVAGETILLLSPGAPGCTIGACWPRAAAHTRNKAAQEMVDQNVMAHYCRSDLAPSRRPYQAGLPGCGVRPGSSDVATLMS